MRAIISPEGAGFVLELVGDDSPTQKFFVSDVAFVVSLGKLVKEEGLQNLSPSEMELLMCEAREVK